MAPTLPTACGSLPPEGANFGFAALREPKGGLSENWITPDWPAPSNVRAVFTTRNGGVSAVPWDSMNLGDHVGDAPASVEANRAELQRLMQIRPVFMQQVHGADVLALNAATENGLTADACITTQQRLACTIMVADCLPVLLTDRDGTFVAAAHAGWRGLAGSVAPVDVPSKGVLEAVFSAVAESIRSQKAPKIIAWIGPCIGPSAFEVGAEVKAVFEASQPDASRFFVPSSSDKYMADLPGLARHRLQALGIQQVYGNDGSAPWCTVSNPARFFSHRRDAGLNDNGFGTTGRMAACIWLE